jgi:hypothetical protein
MNTYWLAVDTDHSSYLELKYRKVVAQGWSGLGDLVSLKPFHPNHKKQFIQNIQVLGDISYNGADWWKNKDRNAKRCPFVIYNLMKLKKGDLIVALEGRTVKGVCQMPSNSLDLPSNDLVGSYRFDKGFEYAHTVGFGAKWIDWNEGIFGFTPTAPSKGVLGVKNLRNDRDAVIKAWEAHQNPQPHI